MKYFTTLLTIASLATSVLSGIIAPPIAGHPSNVEIQSSEFQQAEPPASPALTERGVPLPIIPLNCILNIGRLLNINRYGRRNLQTDLDNRRSIFYPANDNINVRLDFTQVRPGFRYINFSVENRSQFVSNWLILSNYRDTLETTTARETLRIEIPRAQGVSLGQVAPTTYGGCIELPRLDGTWYAQLER